MLQEILEALKAKGFIFKKDHMQPEFDYPLDFFERTEDGAMILCFVKEYEDEVMIELNPFDLIKTWMIEDENGIEQFIIEFDIIFEEFWQIVKD